MNRAWQPVVGADGNAIEGGAIQAPSIMLQLRYSSSRQVLGTVKTSALLLLVLTALLPYTLNGRYILKLMSLLMLVQRCYQEQGAMGITCITRCLTSFQRCSALLKAMTACFPDTSGSSLSDKEESGKRPMRSCRWGRHVGRGLVSYMGSTC
jgi:hypothetical protein